MDKLTRITKAQALATGVNLQEALGYDPEEGDLCTLLTPSGTIHFATHSSECFSWDPSTQVTSLCESHEVCDILMGLMGGNHSN